jgi:hypothetical protein
MIVQDFSPVGQGGRPGTPRYPIEYCPQSLHHLAINLPSSGDECSRKPEITNILVAMHMELSDCLLHFEIRHVKEIAELETETDLLEVLTHNIVYVQELADLFDIGCLKSF